MIIDRLPTSMASQLSGFIAQLIRASNPYFEVTAQQDDKYRGGEEHAWNRLSHKRQKPCKRET